MIDYDKVSIDYMRDIEENENYEFDIFDLDFMNEKQEKNKDDEDMDKYNRYLGMKKGLLEKNKDKFRSLINRLKQKGYTNIKFISKEEEKETYNDDDIEQGFIKDIVAGYNSSEEIEINNSENEEEKQEEEKQEYELYNMYKDEYKNEELKINEQIERLRNEDVARFLDENKIHKFN